jgi:hypothetical protein
MGEKGSCIEKYEKELLSFRDGDPDTCKEDLKEASICDFSSRMIKKLFRYISKVNKR